MSVRSIMPNYFILQDTYFRRSGCRGSNLPTRKRQSALAPAPPLKGKDQRNNSIPTMAIDEMQ
jgi:hypothetical protein